MDEEVICSSIVGVEMVKVVVGTCNSMVVEEMVKVVVVVGTCNSMV